jgi:hypothetical protein
MIAIFLKNYSVIYKGVCVKWSRGDDAYIYIKCVFELFVLYETWVLYESALLVLMLACVLFWVKMEYFEFVILWY